MILKHISGHRLNNVFNIQLKLSPNQHKAKLMKSIKPKKLILDNSMLEEEFFEDALLIGIVCPAPSYQFIWKINDCFNYVFERNHEFEIKVRELYFEVFSFTEADKMIEHIIYCNRKQREFLLEEARNIDYIWMIKGGYLNAQYALQLAEQLKQVSIINYCVVMDHSQLKSKLHLIL